MGSILRALGVSWAPWRHFESTRLPNDRPELNLGSILDSFWGSFGDLFGIIFGLFVDVFRDNVKTRKMARRVGESTKMEGCEGQKS